jgi:hypothetical protein
MLWTISAVYRSSMLMLVLFSGDSAVSNIVVTYYRVQSNPKHRQYSQIPYNATIQNRTNKCPYHLLEHIYLYYFLNEQFHSYLL